MLYVRIEEEFKSYPWCRRILRGLGDEARKKRVPLQEIDDTAHIPRQDQEAAVLLIGASEAWIGREALRANAHGAHPIALTNRQPAGRDGALSAVMMDIPDSMRLAVEYLRGLGCERLALYGVNPNSTSDPWRAQVFERLTGGRRRRRSARGICFTRTARSRAWQSWRRCWANATRPISPCCSA